MEIAGTGRLGDPISDTPAAVAAIQIDILRRAGAGARIALAFSMSRMVCGLSRRAILRAHPGISDDDLAVRFVAAHYGSGLADGLRSHLATRRT